MTVKSESEVAQSCPILSNFMDCSLPGSSVHGIFQARVLEWVAIAFSVYKMSHFKFLAPHPSLNLPGGFYHLPVFLNSPVFLKSVKMQFKSIILESSFTQNHPLRQILAKPLGQILSAAPSKYPEFNLFLLTSPINKYSDPNQLPSHGP